MERKERGGGRKGTGPMGKKQPRNKLLATASIYLFKNLPQTILLSHTDKSSEKLLMSDSRGSTSEISRGRLGKL